MTVISSILSVLAPYDCIGCGSEGSLLCSDCRRTQQKAIARCYQCHGKFIGFETCPPCSLGTSLAAVQAVYRYESHVKDLVWKLKFGRAGAAAAEMASVMTGLVPIDTTSRLIITHAPTATSRVRQRGYDQASLIARSLSRRTGVPYAPLLSRIGQHKQVGATKALRAQQLQYSFRPIRRRQIAGAHILLIDDVITTGATLQAAARVLEAAGAARVEALVFAQA